MRKVLLVDDSASTRALVRAILEDAAFTTSVGGCEVVEATSGFDALQSRETTKRLRDVADKAIVRDIRSHDGDWAYNDVLASSV